MIKIFVDDNIENLILCLFKYLCTAELIVVYGRKCPERSRVLVAQRVLKYEFIYRLISGR